jgi:NAD(P)-dependent dehydrogenase (short-subunit alcohol dehydrogenase family)
MVKLSQIRASNTQNASSSAPRIALFVGGTSGIGKITLAEIAKLGTDFKAYVIGRKQSERAFKIFSEELPETANIVWVEGEASLLSDVKRICDHIKTLESSIDLLFLTTGYAPFGGRESTPLTTPTLYVPHTNKTRHS